MKKKEKQLGKQTDQAQKEIKEEEKDLPTIAYTKKEQEYKNYIEFVLRFMGIRSIYYIGVRYR